MQRAVKVEAQFNGIAWVDVSAWAKMSAGISVVRGRDSEVDDAMAVGTLTLTLDNSDGRFSPALSGKPYYPYVVGEVPIRVSVYVSGAWRVRGFGTVQSWGSSPVGSSWVVAECAVTLNDSLGALPSYELRQAADEVVRSWGQPVHHWPLRDSEGPAKPAAGAVSLVANAGTGWGSGGLLPMDEGSDQHPTFTSGSGGLTLRTSELDIPVPYRIMLVMMGEPTAACTILSLPGGRSIKFAPGDGFDIYPEHPGAIVPFAYPCALYLTVNATTANLDAPDATGFGPSQAPQSISIGKLRTLVLNPTLSGGAVWAAGHLAVTPIGSWLPGTVARRLLGSRTPPPSAPAGDVVSQVLAFSSATLSLSGLSALGGVTMPPLEGRDVSEAIGAIVKGMGARLVDKMDGTLVWVPFPPSGAPVTMPVGAGALSWGTDTKGWVSDCTVTWPDGTSYTATRPDGPRKSDTIEAVHATRTGDQGYADWVVWSPTSARMPEAVYTLSAMSDADVLTLLGITVGTRVAFSTLPAWIPAPQTCIVEGIEESIENDSWTLTLKLSPDVYSRLFILDDATAGVLDSAYLLAP